jgi:rubrerythrin
VAGFGRVLFIDGERLDRKATRRLLRSVRQRARRQIPHRSKLTATLIAILVAAPFVLWIALVSLFPTLLNSVSSLSLFGLTLLVALAWPLVIVRKEHAAERTAFNEIMRGDGFAACARCGGWTKRTDGGTDVRQCPGCQWHERRALNRGSSWRWLFFDFIDPEMGLPQEQRARIRNHAMFSRTVKRWNNVLRFAPFLMMVVFLTSIWADRWLPASATTGSSLITFIPLLLFIVVVAIYSIVLVAYGTAVRRATQQSLHLFGFETCRTCGTSLRGLDDYQRECPECGTPRDRPRCPGCGYVLERIDPADARCPECGIRPHMINDLSRWWWLYLQQVTPMIAMLPDETKLALRRSARSAAIGPILIWIGGIAVVIVLGLIAWYGLFFEPSPPDPWESPVSAWLPLMIFPAWLVMALMVHRTYGAALRKRVRTLGYDVCAHCGGSLIGRSEGIEDCPECGHGFHPVAGPPKDPTLPTPEELERLGRLTHDDVAEPSPKTGNIGAAVCGIAIAVVVTAFYSLLFIGFWLRHFTLLILPVLAGVAAALIVSVALRRVRAEGTRRIRRRARELGHPICLACGRWYREATDGTEHCPACGAAWVHETA